MVLCCKPIPHRLSLWIASIPPRTVNKDQQSTLLIVSELKGPTSVDKVLHHLALTLKICSEIKGVTESWLTSFQIFLIVVPAEYCCQGLFALSGAFGCALTHSLVIPLDVVKTRLQTSPEQYKGANLVSGLQLIYREEGLGGGLQGLLSGWEPTVLGYLWYGITVYPGYESRGCAIWILFWLVLFLGELNTDSKSSSNPWIPGGWVVVRCFLSSKVLQTSLSFALPTRGALFQTCSLEGLEGGYGLAAPVGSSKCDRNISQLPANAKPIPMLCSKFSFKTFQNYPNCSNLFQILPEFQSWRRCAGAARPSGAFVGCCGHGLRMLWGVPGWGLSYSHGGGSRAQCKRLTAGSAGGRVQGLETYLETAWSRMACGMCVKLTSKQINNDKSDHIYKQ